MKAPSGQVGVREGRWEMDTGIKTECIGIRLIAFRNEPHITSLGFHPVRESDFLHDDGSVVR